MSSATSKHSVRTVVFLILVAVCLALSASALYWLKAHKQTAADSGQKQDELQDAPERLPTQDIRIRAVKVTKSEGKKRVELVGESRPYSTVTLYSKVSGYIKNITVDKGDRVKKDQVLAVLESPETDKQYLAGLADAQFKDLLRKRIHKLSKRKLVAPQEDEQASAEAEIARYKADGLRELNRYKIIRAPFDGTVTSRYLDDGALVQSAANTQSAQPLFTISNIDQLRVYGYVGQHEAPFVTEGMPVSITMSENPGLEISAKVTRISGELDPKTKTLLTEIDIDNRAHQFISGGFVQLTFNLKIPAYLQIPTEALVIQKDKSMAAVVDTSGILHFREIKIADTDGRTLTVSKGLQEGEIVGLNVGSQVSDQAHVVVVLPQEKKVPNTLAGDDKSSKRLPANGPEHESSRTSDVRKPEK